MLSEKEREALFIISGIPGMYGKRLFRMAEYAGSYEEALRISEKEYYAAGVFQRPKTADKYESYRKDSSYLSLSRKKYHSLKENGIRMVDHTEEAMPVRLRGIPDPPPVLFVSGGLPDDGLPSASIVGSRKSSEYGNEVAHFFGRELSAAGVQIISGMAIGIDSCSLSGALYGGKKGFAVLGSGVDICYPYQSRGIYEKMSAGSGGVISEFVPGTAPVSNHFIMRNRIISALGDVLIVIEAAEKSGTSITVDFALEQGKDVFALPGRITDPLGRGCNRLLKEGAFVLTEPQDVLSYLGIDSRGSARNLKEKPMDGLSSDEKKVLLSMGTEVMHVEDIAEATGFDLQYVVHLVNMLELHGNLRSHGQAYYSKIYR